MRNAMAGGRFTELRQRIFFVIGAMLVFRIGSFITVPGIDPGTPGKEGFHDIAMPSGRRQHQGGRALRVSHIGVYTRLKQIFYGQEVPGGAGLNKVRGLAL